MSSEMIVLKLRVLRPVEEVRVLRAEISASKGMHKGEWNRKCGDGNGPTFRALGRKPKQQDDRIV